LLRRVLDETSPWKDVLKALTPNMPRLKAKAWLRRFNYKEQHLPSLSPAQRERLWSLFAPDVAELEAVLERRLDCWGPQRSNVSSVSERRPASFAPKIEQT
jgi:hypothetical protein